MGSGLWFSTIGFQPVVFISTNGFQPFFILMRESYCLSPLTISLLTPGHQGFQPPSVILQKGNSAALKAKEASLGAAELLLGLSETSDKI